MRECGKSKWVKEGKEENEKYTFHDLENHDRIIQCRSRYENTAHCRAVKGSDANEMYF